MKKDTKNNKNNITSYIAIIDVIVIILGIFAWIKITDKTKYFNKVFNSSYIASKEFVSNFDLSRYLENNSTLNISLTGENNDDPIKLQLKNYVQKTIFGLSLSYKNYDLNYIGQNGKYYLTSNSLLDNTYELDENEPYNQIISFSNNSDITDNINNILRKLKNALRESLNKKYISKKKTKTLIGENQEKVTKYSYNLNKDSLSKLIKTISKDEDLQNAALSALRQNSKYKDITYDDLEKVLEEIAIDGTFNIYVKNGKIKKVSIYLLNTVEIEYYTTDDYAKMTIKSEKNHNIFTFNYNFENKELAVTLTKNQNKVSEFLIENQDNLNISYSMYVNDDKISGKITNKFNDDSKESGVLTISNSKTNVNIAYSKTKENDIEMTDYANAVKLSDPTDNEIAKITDAVEELFKSDFIKNFIELFNGLQEE